MSSTLDGHGPLVADALAAKEFLKLPGYFTHKFNLRIDVAQNGGLTKTGTTSNWTRLILDDFARLRGGGLGLRLEKLRLIFRH